MINELNKKEQLQKDIKQLKSLIFQTQNQRVGQFLAGKLAQLKAQLQLIIESQVKPIQIPIKQIQKKQPEFITVSKFAWEQVEGTKKVKIMINFQGIKKQCQLSQINCQFKQNSFTVKIQQYKGKNYIFSIPKLYSEIIPQKCSYQLSNNYLNIKLQKKHNADWIDINFKKDIFTANKKQQRKTLNQMNQQDKLMDMIKKVYQDGDPKMQQAIKQAFASAQDKRKGKF